VSDDPRDILIPKEQVRKVGADKVEILGGDESAGPSARNPFEGTPFQFKNIKVISGGPLVFLLPILIPLILLAMLIALFPLLLFGRFFFRKQTR
jgi:hypothetical protein